MRAEPIGRGSIPQPVAKAFRGADVTGLCQHERLLACRQFVPAVLNLPSKREVALRHEARSGRGSIRHLSYSDPLPDPPPFRLMDIRARYPLAAPTLAKRLRMRSKSASQTSR